MSRDDAPKCRLCSADGSQQRIRANSVFGGLAAHKFWQCAACDAVYLYPVPSIEDEKRFYAQEFEKFMAIRSKGERDWSNAETHKQTNQDQVVRRLPFLQDYVQPGKSVLEIGCSTGFMLDTFRQAGMQCIGVEPSGEFLPYLHEQGYAAVESLDEVSPGQNFDLIVHFFVFEHIRDPFAFLGQSYALLADDGVMVAEIPCVNDPLTSLYDISAFEEFYWSIAHHYYYSPAALAYIMERMGYRYRIVPEQRYDLSNHMHWMMAGKPGGQGKYNDIFSEQLLHEYREALKKSWKCDTVFLYIWKQENQPACKT